MPTLAREKLKDFYDQALLARNTEIFGSKAQLTNVQMRKGERTMQNVRGMEPKGACRSCKVVRSYTEQRYLAFKLRLRRCVRAC